MRKMLPPLPIYFLLGLFPVVPVTMKYAEFPSEHYNVDADTVVFPSSLYSPFATPNRAYLFDESEDLQMKHLHAVDALFAVTTRLKALLGLDTNKNLLVSPISTTTALAEILLGARGPSRRHLLKMMSTINKTSSTAEVTVAEFHQQLGGLIKLLQTNSDYDDSYRLHLASAMFFNPEIRLLPTFAQAITDLYSVELQSLNFSADPIGSLHTINQWAAMHTNGIIKRVYSHPLPVTTAAVLTNAIYFKGDWETPFNPRFTIPGKFKSSEYHTVDVEYMRGQVDLMYVESKRIGCRMIALPYKHAKAAMYVILPDTGDVYDVRKFTAELSMQDVLELIGTMKTSSVTLVMPKMKLAQTFSIRKVLAHFKKQVDEEMKESRMKRNAQQDVRCHGWNCTQYYQPHYNSTNIPEGNYSQNPSKNNTEEDTSKNDTANSLADVEEYSFDFSGASPDHHFRIDDIVHHIYLEVSEVGTVAAAVGGTTVDYIGEYTNFVMDRPFLFFIRHEITGTPFFWGTVVDPVSDNGT